MRRGVAIAISVLAMCAVHPASADPQAHPPLSQALKGDARVLYDSARDLFKAGDFASAYAKFQRAQELSQDPRLYWNMAACERKAKHNANALRLIEVYAKEGEGWLTDDDKREATRAAAAVRAFVAGATVTTRPSDGVEIFVDDVRIATTPVDKAIWIDQGAHRIRFAKQGFKSVERSEEIPAGADLTWAVELESATSAPPPAPPPPSPTQPPPPPPPPPEGPSHTGPIVLGAAGLAVAIGGGVLTGIGTAKFGSLRDQCGSSCNPDDWHGYRTMQTVGDVLLVVGGTALVASVVWLIAQPSRREAK